ncbi:hypothetical protein ACUH78_18750 [Thauera sp. ZXT1-4]|uniref:hypothetical protein n=1 Tax=Thauera sp. ZXT1-4 TaxID=3460294 RepID=UPI0040407015
MLDVLNAIFLAGNLIAQNVNVVARADEDILVQQGVKVYAISMTEQAPAWTDKCKYGGVMVEYARDWPEEQSATGEVLPPEPDKPIGYALILTEERCPEKEARKIFNTDSKFFAPLFGKKFVIREGGPMDTRDYWNQREEHRAKWMPQVLRTIEAEAATNPVAKAFVEEMHARQALSEIAPKQSDQTTPRAPN